MANQIGGSIVWNLDVDDSKFSAGMSKAKATASGVADEVENKFQTLKSTITNSLQEAEKASQLFATGLLAVGAATATAAGFGIKYAADLETMRAGFITLLGSAKLADQAISRIQKDAASTPFEFKGLVNANQLLTSVTKNSGDSERLLLNVGKALTAMGKGQPELDRIIVNLQQIGAIGHANAVDIKQFAYAGIPIYDLLNDKLNKTKSVIVDNSKAIGDNNAKLQELQGKLKVAQLQQSEFGDKTKASTKLLKENQISKYTQEIAELTGKTGKLTSSNGKLTTSQTKLDDAISSGKITFDLLKETFNEAGEGSGRFAKAFEEQGGTFNQVFSNLKDNLGITASQLVKQTGLFDAVKGALVRLTGALTYFASPAGIQQVLKYFDQIKANAPIIIGLIVGGLTPALYGLLAPIILSTLHLLPFIAAGVALGAIVQFLVQEMGGWGNVLLTVQGAFQALGQAYNTYLKPGIDALISQIQTQLLPALSQLWEQLKPILIPALQLFGQILVGVIIVALQGFITELQFVVGAVTAVSQVISGMISFFQSLPATISAVWTSITTAITSAIQTIITAVINLPTTIANAVGQMIVSLATFLGFVVGIFVYGIPAALQATVNFFIALPGMIYSTLISLYGTIVSGWTSIWAFIRTIVPQIIQTVITWFATLPAQVGVWLDTTRNRTATGFKDIWNAIINEISSWPGQLYNWGVNIANAFVDGIRSAIGHIVDAFKEGLNKAKSVIQGHSPPIAGPFKEIDVWGYNVGQAWVGGVQKAIQGLSLESPTTGFPSSSSPSVSPALARGSGSLVNVEQMNVRQDSDITDIARELGFRIETSSGYTNG